MAGNLDAMLAELEVTRLASLGKLKVWIGAALGGAVVLSILLFAGDSAVGGGIVLALGLVASVVLWIWQTGKLKREFKQQVMPVLLKGIDPSLIYNVNGHISEAEFKEANLFTSPDRYSGKDLVAGRIGETVVRFSLVNAEERYQDTDTDSDGNSTTTTKYRTIFCGLFFIADFNKHFGARTKIEPHGVNFIDKLFGSHIELEDPEFNKMFAVSSTDQVEARYILTPSLMERLMHLRAKVGKFKTAFVNEHLIMAIDVPYSAFEPSVMKPLTESTQIDKVVTKLKTVTGIVEDLGLNTRIWTKV